MGIFTCSECKKIMNGVCPSCQAWYCDECLNWHCDPSLFPPLAGGRAVLGLSRGLLLGLVLVLLGFYLLSACTSGSSSDLSVLGGPTLSASFIDQVLSKHHSPAIGAGQAFYDMSVRYGIDDAVALAFFQHESGFGLNGEATVTLSIGNIRCLSGYPCPHGYAQFPSWRSGIQAWYVLLSGPLYVKAGLTTLPSIIHRYAPAADHNNEAAYVQAVTQSVQSWRAGQDQYGMPFEEGV